ncbi:DUF3093 domain-containing protein [Actinokineospora fastidiosa]|uniref:DUF3093 domain-containing protein n=1 Tax=Actinokineospora fastidiosa TaxID=1816 RepID=A0A918GP09_9PSEU|nr:DUF3093 domain-containing protein [Actinokineospora fastidiosa]GGS50713.1 hypothetical protein GCM10010171_52340 [Actinokineospora fastidiosa]
MDDRSRTVTQRTGHAERLYVTWYWWPLPLTAAALLAAEVHMGYPGLRAWLPYAVLIPLAVLAVWSAGRSRVAVEDGELRVGEARLPLEFVGEVEVFPARSKRAALGPNLDPAAYLVHKGWVGPLVRVRVDDPADPTPYWLFSTRHPERVVAALGR